MLEQSGPHGRGTYNLRGSQSHLLVIFFVLGLELHVLDPLLKLSDICIDLVHGGTLAFSLHLARLVFFVVLLLEVFDDFKPGFEFSGFHFLFTFGDEFFVVFLEFLLNLLLLLFNQESLMLFDPVEVDVLVQFEILGAPLLLEGRLQVQQLLLQTPLLIAKPLDLWMVKLWSAKLQQGEEDFKS